MRRLVASGLTVHSVLLTPPRLATLADVLDRPVSGVRRGAAGARRRSPASTSTAAASRSASGRAPAPLPRGARALVVAEDLTDVDNLGALARHAAAFGADALVLSPRCADPFYRKAIRVSLGAVFSLPDRAGARRWPGDLEALRGDGVAVVGAVVEPGATPLARFTPPARFALLLGAEGPGLSAAARACCDHLVTIPMSPGADSLNVATAGAIFLYALTHAASALGAAAAAAPAGASLSRVQLTNSLRVSRWQCGQKQASPSPTRTARMVVPQTTHGLPSRPRTLRKSRTLTSIGSSRRRISAIASVSTRPIAA